MMRLRAVIVAMSRFGLRFPLRTAKWSAVCYAAGMPVGDSLAVGAHKAVCDLMWEKCSNIVGLAYGTMIEEKLAHRLEEQAR